MIYDKVYYQALKTVETLNSSATSYAVIQALSGQIYTATSNEEEHITAENLAIESMLKSGERVIIVLMIFDLKNKTLKLPRKSTIQMIDNLSEDNKNTLVLTNNHKYITLIEVLTNSIEKLEMFAYDLGTEEELISYQQPYQQNLNGASVYQQPYQQPLTQSLYSASVYQQPYQQNLNGASVYQQPYHSTFLNDLTKSVSVYSQKSSVYSQQSIPTVMQNQSTDAPNLLRDRLSSILDIYTTEESLNEKKQSSKNEEHKLSKKELMKLAKERKKQVKKDMIITERLSKEK